MKLTGRGSCFTCYSNSVQVTCKECGKVRPHHGRGLCYTCSRKLPGGPWQDGDHPYGPREHGRLVPRPRTLDAVERRALADVLTQLATP